MSREVQEDPDDRDTHNERNLFYIWLRWHFRQSAMVHCVFCRRGHNRNDQAEVAKQFSPANKSKSIAVQRARNTLWT